MKKNIKRKSKTVFFGAGLEEGNLLTDAVLISIGFLGLVISV